MRISQIGEWSNCEQMALGSPARSSRVTTAAAWVGTLAHSRLTGVPVVEAPAHVAWDEITRVPRHSELQASDIADEGRRLLAELGWTPLEREQIVGRPDSFSGDTGHLDMRAWHDQHGEAVIDLKTGRDVGAAWLQVGGYIDALWDGGGPTIHPNSNILRAPLWGGVLHVPRVGIRKAPTGTLSFRRATELVRVWRVARERIAAVLQGEPALRTPGQHCQWCREHPCVVRTAGGVVSPAAGSR